MKIAILFLTSMVYLNFTGAMIGKKGHQPAILSPTYLTVPPGSIAFVQMPTDRVYKGTLKSGREYPSWLISKSENYKKITIERFFLYVPQRYCRLSWTADIEDCGYERNNSPVQGYTGYVKTDEGVFMADLVLEPELEIIEEVVETIPHIFIKSYLDNKIYGGALRRLEKKNIPGWILRYTGREIQKRQNSCLFCYPFKK
ncbi:uncharacterized protein LOC117170681 isoform X1 [Belonocnema kinseyi]|uniref:uncharacterized protein LOC117170681 isoform X1 n=1 Tax=Belonocnema kinseyi TaxID=2817044 RepID=UPI00143CDF74|nr:uncharacterized protein LOC117170681 isoform X1 [Belonocnema kinseyi]